LGRLLGGLGGLYDDVVGALELEAALVAERRVVVVHLLAARALHRLVRVLVIGRGLILMIRRALIVIRHAGGGLAVPAYRGRGYG
jgi:hypothetical protein